LKPFSEEIALLLFGTKVKHPQSLWSVLRHLRTMVQGVLHNLQVVIYSPNRPDRN